MERQSGRTVRRVIALLLLLLIAGGAGAANQSAETAYREARAIADRGDLSAALARAESALRLLPPSSQDEWTWALRILRAEALLRTGDPKTALAVLSQELPPALRTSEAEVRRQITLGLASWQKPDESLPHLRKALEIANAHQPRLQIAAHLSLGNVVPDIREAERHLRTTIELARKRGDSLNFANAQNALARRYTDVQRYAEAIEAGEAAAKRYLRLGVTGRLTTLYGNIGWTYLELGDWETAADDFTRAEELAAKTGDEPNRVRWLNQLGNVQFAQRQFPKAERYYLDALARGRAIQTDEIAAVLTNLARTAIETKRYEQARRYHSEAMERKRALRDPDEILRSRIIDARIDAATGEEARAEKTLRAVIASSKAESATRWEAEARLARLSAKQGRNAEAESLFEGALRTARAARKSIGSPELRLSFFNVAGEAFMDYVDFLVRQGRAEDALSVTETVRAQTLEEGLNASAATSKLDARAIARQNDAIVLSYWLGRERSFLWVVTPESVAVHELAAADAIEEAAERYRRDLLGARDSLQLSGARGEALYRMLVGPAGRIAKNSRVIVVADGRLHALNFETLVVPSPRRYWIEDVVITNASSLRLLARKAPPPAGEPSILIVGNPPSPGFPRLPHAAEEMASVARHFARREVLSGDRATPAAYRAQNPGSFAYVHFVAHGVATRIRPLESAVILAPDANGDYRLFAREIIEQPTQARLVTISSCHGAGARTFSGEGLVGLAWAFLRAGASQVIAALWEVDDRATPELMNRMYAAIRAGRDPALALRDAKLVLVRGKGAFRKPQYWAPFVLYSGS